MEITEFCTSGFTAHARAVRSLHGLHVWYLWRMPEMDAPRALVFQPLVKENEALGTRLLCSVLQLVIYANMANLGLPCHQGTSRFIK